MSPNRRSRYSSSRSGHPNLDLVGDKVPVLTVHTPGLLTGIVNNVCTKRISVFYVFVMMLLLLHRMKTRRQIRIRQSSSSSTRPPRSLSYQSPLDAITTPRSKDSYQRPPSQPFRRDSHKQSSYKSRQSSSSKGQFSTKDNKPSQSNFRSGGWEQGSARREKDNKGSQQSCSFNKRGENQRE